MAVGLDEEMLTDWALVATCGVPDESVALTVNAVVADVVGVPVNLTEAPTTVTVIHDGIVPTDAVMVTGVVYVPPSVSVPL
jgi:hypothetical protein